MSYDVFCKIADIPGESTDDKHAEWIELTGFQHGLLQPTGASESSGARGGERVTQESFVIEKRLDKASAKLADHCCKGENIATIEIELCRATGEKQVYAKYEMTNCLVTSYRPVAAAAGDDPVPMEKVSFSCGTLKLTYTQTDPETGASKGNVDFGWDFTHNKSV